MAVYVDTWEQRADVPNGNHVVRGVWSHLMADTEEELHEMAQAIGLRRVWFQHKDRAPWHDHYDVTLSKKREAIRLGAIELDIREMAAFMERKRLEYIEDSRRLSL